MTRTKKGIPEFNRRCYSGYIKDISKRVPGFPEKYLFPYGNPIQPVLSISSCEKEIMLIGAFPSARFEIRNNRLIPVANNLSPFAREEYFDGYGFRKQASREILDKHYFPVLNKVPEDIWITDIVKVYLFPDDHIKNCEEVNNRIKYVNTHKMFNLIAKASLGWIYEEIKLCNPKIIITLGEVCARTLLNDFTTLAKLLLTGDLKPFTNFDNSIRIAHLGHPEIFRRNASDWRKDVIRSLDNLASNLD
jgi:hypothetical protein